MIDIRPILQVAGILLATLAIAMFLPMTADLVEGNDDWQVFLGAGFLTLVGMRSFSPTAPVASGLTVRQGLPADGRGLDRAVRLCRPAVRLRRPRARLRGRSLRGDGGPDHDGSDRRHRAAVAPGRHPAMACPASVDGGIGIIVTAVAVLPMLRIA